MNRSLALAPRFPDRSSSILLGCRIGNRSANAAAMLQKAGYGNVVNLEGGFCAFTGTVGKPCG